MNDDAAGGELIDGDAWVAAPVPALVWVACYLTSRSWGGPEEGGWWFNQGELVTDPGIYRALGGTPRSFLAEDDAYAYAYAARLRLALAALNEGWPPSTAPSARACTRSTRCRRRVCRSASRKPGRATSSSGAMISR